MNEFLENIRLIQQEKNISEELIFKNLENSLKAAYKKHFGTDENAVVRFHEDFSGVSLYAKKRIVTDEEFEDPVLEVTLSEARQHDHEAEIGDELLFEQDLKNDFGRGAVYNAKQRSRQGLKELQKDTLYSEFNDKLGEVIIGYNQREQNGNVYISLGKIEGVLPKRFQSPREIYRPGDRLKVLIEAVRRHSKGGLQVILSRSNPELVRKLFEVEVSEIYDGTVDIYKVVREAGARTKVAVYSYRDDIDPVGACVGAKGMRIQNVIHELEGEKIDILRYDEDPIVFIKNAVFPAQAQQVHIVSQRNKSALVVVPDEQLSLAIGKQGVNIRLASRLVGWSIDVKTQEQFAQMEFEPEKEDFPEGLFHQSESIQSLEELEGMTEELLAVLEDKGITGIADLQDLSLKDIEKILVSESLDVVEAIQSIVDNNADIIDSYVVPPEEGSEIFIYQCPECNYEIDATMTECPNCQVSFEEESSDF